MLSRRFFYNYLGRLSGDVKKLKRSEVIIGVDGEQWLVSRRLKTDISARIPLLPAALTILDRYKDYPHCQGKDVVLPINSNQKMNAYLKEIADVCGIHKKLDLSHCPAFVCHYRITHHTKTELNLGLGEAIMLLEMPDCSV
ncbi:MULTISPECIES: site-specific integrase [Niastella]|uniref:Piwi domain-containing protein n=1 Tax=Niastella soli TaxID=2821487 RepID=A0ABS3YZ64_9BACT|nr:hypothetical protein [Niastella soli]MBO9203221.1 hypothetical protein [Niastella soli]